MYMKIIDIVSNFEYPKNYAYFCIYILRTLFKYFFLCIVEVQS